MNNIEMYVLPVGMLVIVLLVGLIYLLVQSKKEIKSQKKYLKGKDEKIKWLREIAAENEHRYTAKDHETQKQIMALEHTIELLETQAKEGTKNQVVSKIEALQTKREKALNRTGLEL